MSNQVKLGLTLFALGMLGILSMLTVTIPLDSIPKDVLEKIPPGALKYLVLINPMILLLLAIVAGTQLHQKVGLTVPTISAWLKIAEPKITFLEQAKSGVLLGLLAGGSITLIAWAYQSAIPQEFIDIQNKIKVTTLARFCYGGLTEELLLRFGFMTLMVWLVNKLTTQLNNTTYWTAIAVASALFAVGHFPVVFNAVQHPTASLLTYVFIGNALAGIAFGWLYWKKGLEAAFIGHIFAHVAMMAGEQVLQLS